MISGQQYLNEMGLEEEQFDNIIVVGHALEMDGLVGTFLADLELTHKPSLICYWNDPVSVIGSIDTIGEYFSTRIRSQYVEPFKTPSRRGGHIVYVTSGEYSPHVTICNIKQVMYLVGLVGSVAVVATELSKADREQILAKFSDWKGEIEFIVGETVPKIKVLSHDTKIYPQLVEKRNSTSNVNT